MPKIELRLIGDDDKVLATKTRELIVDEDLTHENIYHGGYWDACAETSVEVDLLRRGRDLMRDALLILKGIGRVR